MRWARIAWPRSSCIELYEDRAIQAAHAIVVEVEGARSHELLAFNGEVAIRGRRAAARRSRGGPELVAASPGVDARGRRAAGSPILPIGPGPRCDLSADQRLSTSTASSAVRWRNRYSPARRTTRALSCSSSSCRGSSRKRRGPIATWCWSSTERRLPIPGSCCTRAIGRGQPAGRPGRPHPAAAGGEIPRPAGDGDRRPGAGCRRPAQRDERIPTARGRPGRSGARGTALAAGRCTSPI